jgi:hypothetical protein
MVNEAAQRVVYRQVGLRRNERALAAQGVLVANFGDDGGFAGAGRTLDEKQVWCIERALDGSALPLVQARLEQLRAVQGHPPRVRGIGQPRPARVEQKLRQVRVLALALFQ